MPDTHIIEADELLVGTDAVIVDCRFALTDEKAGRRLYEAGHVPGAHYLDLNGDLAGPVGKHGGRHPLPDPATFANRLAALGISLTTQVIIYDDSRFAFPARLWWMMRALGYRSPRLLNGGYSAFLGARGTPEQSIPVPQPCAVPRVGTWQGVCDIDRLRDAQRRGALLVDSREARRYEGLEEPIDPVAGHIPGAINRPWQEVTDAGGWLLAPSGQRSHWAEVLEAPELVVYCGSGVTACVNLLSLAVLGREDAQLYAGSWSDWCSYIEHGVDSGGGENR